MNKLEEKIFENRKLAKELYYQSVLEKETPIIYRILNQESFDNIKKRRNLNIKDDKYPTDLEYRRTYKGYKIDISSCFGFLFYMINIEKPKERWKKNDRFIVGELKPYANYPAIYNKPFGAEYYDLIRFQEYIKFNLEQMEKLDCSDFIIEKDENWPCYFFKKGTDEIICMSKKIEDKNLKLENIQKLPNKPNNERLQNYKKCIGCGNYMNLDVQVSKCELCGGELFIPVTEYMIEKEEK